MAAAACGSTVVSVASHPAGLVVRLPRPSLLPSSCLPPLPLTTLPPRAVTLTLRAAVAFSLVEPRRLPRYWSVRSSSWSILQDFAGVLNYVDMFDGVCALVGAFWCLDGDIVVFCSCGCNTAASCISSFCAFVGDFPFVEGIQCFQDGAIVVAGVAHGLEGVYWI